MSQTSLVVPPRSRCESPVMSGIHAEVFGSELIKVAPVRAAKNSYGHTVDSFHRLKRARVFPTMNLSAGNVDREHAAAPVTAGREIMKHLTIVIPIQIVITVVNIVFMDIHEDAQLRAHPKRNVA